MKIFLPVCSICMLTVVGSSSSHSVPFRIMIAVNAAAVIFNIIQTLRGVTHGRKEKV